MANICTCSVRFLFFEDEGINEIFIPKPSSQQDLPVQSGACRLWASVKGLPAFLGLHTHTKEIQNHQNFKRVDAFEDFFFFHFMKKTLQ